MELQRKHDLKSEEIFLKKIIFEVSIERSKDFSECLQGTSTAELRKNVNKQSLGYAKNNSEYL